MANVEDYVAQIESARYGKDVRKSICDSIRAMNEESEEAISTAKTSQTSAKANADKAKESADSAQDIIDEGTQSVENLIDEGTQSINALVTQAQTDAQGLIEQASEHEENSKTYSEEAKRYRDEAEAIVNVDIATTEKAGIVKPDGTTITVEPDGTIHGIAQPVDALTEVGETLELVTRKGGVGVNRVLGKSYKSKNLLKPTLATTTNDGITCTNNGDGTYTLNGTATAETVFYFNLSNSISFPKKARLLGCPKGGTSSTYHLTVVNSNYQRQVHDYGEGANATNADTWSRIAFRVLNGVTVNNLVVKPMAINLGTYPESSSATYDDFEPYGMWSAGEDGEIVVKEGEKNNEIEIEVEGKYIGEDGTIGTDVSLCYSKLIEVSSKPYHIHYNKSGRTNDRLHAYDKNGNWLKQFAQLTNADDGKKLIDYTFIPTDDIAYIRLSFASNHTNARILADFKSVFIPLSEPLRSVKDVKDEIIVNEDGSGQLIRRIKSVDLGSLDWIKSSTVSGRFDSNSTTDKKIALDNVLCDKYTTINTLDFVDKSIRGSTNSNIVVNDTTYTDATAFKTAMSGVELIYELVTPTVTDLTPEQVKALHSLVSYDGKTYIDTADKYAKATLDVVYGDSDGVALALKGINESVVNKEDVEDVTVPKSYEMTPSDIVIPFFRQSVRKLGDLVIISFLATLDVIHTVSFVDLFTLPDELKPRFSDVDFGISTSASHTAVRGVVKQSGTIQISTNASPTVRGLMISANVVYTIH